MLFSQMSEAVGRVIAGDPGSLGTMRLDLSVDVPEIPLDWFYTRVRIPQKKILKIWGTRTPGLHYGGTRDMIRIYDKLEELRHRKKPINFPFASWPRASRPQTVTRVERQFRGATIPSPFRHLGGLRRIAIYDPFNQIRFEEPRRWNFGKAPAGTVLRSMGYKQLVEEEGMAAATMLLNKASPGNASRLRKTLCQVDSSTQPDLYAMFQREALAQMEET